MQTDVWVPGATVDLDMLKREYDTVIFTRAAIRHIEHALLRVTSELETLVSAHTVDSQEIEMALDDARKVLLKLREVL